jgi:GTP1/Obg family GTP-binding protein
MDAHLVEATIKTFLTEIRTRLDKVAGIGRAADACAGAGFYEKGVEVALDIEQLLYEVTTLLNAASLINRIAQQSQVPRPAGAG